MYTHILFHTVYSVLYTLHSLPLCFSLGTQVCQLNATLQHTMGGDLSPLGVRRDAEIAALLGTAQPNPDVARAAERGEYRLLYLTEKLIFSGGWISTLQTLHAAGQLLLIAVDEAHVVCCLGIIVIVFGTHWHSLSFASGINKLLRKRTPYAPTMTLKPLRVPYP